MWTRISSAEYVRQYKGCVLRVKNLGMRWSWSVTHTSFVASDTCCTLHQAKVAAEHRAREEK